MAKYSLNDAAVARARELIDRYGFDELEEYRQPVTYRRAAGQ